MSTKKSSSTTGKPPTHTSTGSTSSIASTTTTPGTSHGRTTSTASVGPPPATPPTGNKSAKPPKPPSVESLLLEEALQTERGEDIAVSIVSGMVKSAMDKLSEHYIQQVAMNQTAKQAIDFVMQALEWSLLVHDDGEKLQVRKVLTEKSSSSATASSSPTDAESSPNEDDVSSIFTDLPPAPSPIAEPFNRSRPVLDVVASKLSLPTTYNQIWTCEEEPATVDLDRWARGVIPTKAHSELPFASVTMNGTNGAFTVHEVDNEGGSTPNSLNSRSRSVTPSQSRARMRSPAGSSFGGSQYGAHRKALSIAEEKESSAAKLPPVPYKLDMTLTKEQAQKEKQRENELKRLEKRKKLEGEIQQIRDADIAERERMDRIQQELRHKSYTFDNRGNVILIAPIPVEKFPPFQATPQIKVKDEYLTDEQELEIAKREKRNRFKKGGISSQTASKPSPPAAEEKQQPITQSPSNTNSKSNDIGLQKKKVKKVKQDTSGFVDLNATQPSLMQTLTLTKGVTLKQGQLSKTFDPRSAPAQQTEVGTGIDNQSADLKGLTRKEYLKKLELKRLADAKFLPATTTNILAAATVSNVISPLAAAAQSVAQQSAKQLSRPGSSSQLKNSPHSSAGNLGATGTEWDAETEWDTSNPTSPSKGGVDSTTGVDAQSTSYQRPTTSEAFNYELLNDPSWGQNPPIQRSPGSHVLSPHPPHHVHPSPSERQLVLGRRAKQPRERSGVDTKTSQPSLRQHLPPPGFGKTVGHGLQVAGVVDESEVIGILDGGGSTAPSSPSRSFAKLPPPQVVTQTEKARLYFKPQK